MKFLSFFIMMLLAMLTAASVTANKRQAPNPDIVETLTKVNSDSLLNYMQGLQDFETRFMFAPNRKEVATWIMDKFLSFGVPEVKLDSFEIYNSFYDTTTWQYNIEARIPGTTFPERELLLMGHYDSYVDANGGDPMVLAPGANDNASGVAAIIECARVIMLEGYEPLQTIVFLATAAEEFMNFGDSGAKHYADQAADDNRDIGMVINNDMIAWNNGTWTVSLIHNNASERIVSLALHATENYTSLNYIFPEFGTFADLTYFYNNGFRGIWFMENFTPEFYPWYHSINDVVDHLDTAYHAEITRLNLSTILTHESLTIDAGLEEIIGLPKASCTGKVSPMIQVQNYGLDTINMMDIDAYINNFHLFNTKWTGTIPPSGDMWLELPELSFEVLAQNVLEVTLDSINGTDDQLPLNNSYSVTIDRAVETPNEIKLFMRLDQNPEEITWELTDVDGTIYYSGGPYDTPLATISETMILENNGCYEFSIFDEAGDGLQVPGFFVLYYGSDIQIISGSSFGSQVVTEFDVGGTMFLTDNDHREKVRIYPNPANEIITLYYRPISSASVYKLYNTLGNTVAKGEISNDETILYLDSLPKGLYILIVEDTGRIHHQKLIKK